jgi:hypothetical protein
MFLIRDYGKKEGCRTIEQVQEILRTKFAGRSVSVQYPTKPHGMVATLFVDVRQDGEIVESYGENASVDFDEIAARQMF